MTSSPDSQWQPTPPEHAALAALVEQLPRAYFSRQHPRELNRLIRDGGGQKLLRDRDDATGTTTCIYVHPDDQRVAEALQPLIDWRRLQGYEVIAIPVGNESSAEDIRTAIREVYLDHALEFVCLVGDAGGEFSIPAFDHNTSDYPYSLLDGDDPLPEVAVGRLSFNTINELEGIIAKILAYEKDPDVDNPDRYRRGAVAAGSEKSGLSTILVSRWVRDLMLDRGFSSVDTFWFTMGGDLGNYLTDAFDRGSSFINYRGWTGIEGWSERSAYRLNNDNLPVALLLGCNTGDYDGEGYGYTEALLRASGGAIGAIGTAGSQGCVDYNNAMMAGFYRRVLQGDVYHLGWALVAAKLELFAAYDVLQLDALSGHASFTNLMGDPATIIWRNVPRQVQLQIPNDIYIGPGQITVGVTDADNQPVASARVGLFKSDEIEIAAYTGADGQALLQFDPLAVQPGQAEITVCGDAILPVTQNVELQASDHQLHFTQYAILDDNNLPRIGNGDGIANPNETVTLRVIISNIGAQEINGHLDFALESADAAVNVIEGDYAFNGAIPSGDTISAEFLVGLSNGFPDLTPISFILTASFGNEQWEIPFNISGEAPRWAFVTTSLNEKPSPEDELFFSITIKNGGSLPVGDASAILESLTDWVYITNGEGSYPALDTAVESGGINEYGIELDYTAPYDTDIYLILRLTSADNYTQAIPIILRTADPPVKEPTGPDLYGYYAIDGRDDSNIAPIFNWVELNPDKGGSGIKARILDQGEDEDQSVAIDLPFAFRYYGMNYRRLTICSNGWAAFGDQRNYVDFRNQHIGAPQGPRAQLCPWWDDLYQPNGEGNVFYWSDSVNHRVIVEWDHLRRYIGLAGPGAYETFQLILLDPAWYPTYTGDGDILFQYAGVRNEGRVDAHGTPYATIGIGNPDDTGGLEYSFWNQWSEAAAPVDSGIVLRFATSREHDYCRVVGMVRAARDSVAVPGATVRTTPGGWATADTTGHFAVTDALAARQLSLSVFSPGYNTQFRQVEPVAKDSTDSLIFYLTRPEIAINPGGFTDTVRSPELFKRPFSIANNGDGPLNFQISFAPHDGDGVAHWDSLLEFGVTQVVGDDRVLGVAYTGDQFFVSGGNNGNDPKYFYHFNSQGHYFNRTEQPCQSLWGMHDLAWDGTNLYGGSDAYIYKWNPTTAELDSITSPLQPARGVAVDPRSGEIWIANASDPIYRLSPTGEVLRTYQQRLNPYGLAWHPADTTGCPLYIFSDDGETHLAISRLDTSDGEVNPVTELHLRPGDRPGGCEITSSFNGSQWAFVAVLQNPDGDRVVVLDAGLNTSWLSVWPSRGVLPQGTWRPGRLTIDPSGLSGGAHDFDMVIRHNAAGGELRIPISINYVVSAPSDEHSPEEFALEPVYPNPGNGVARIRFHLPHSGAVNLTVWDAQGRRISELVKATMNAGDHEYLWDNIQFPSGIYLISLAVSEGHATRKFVLLK